MATIKDVAKLAGVTPATVSNVIHKKGLVAEATLRRVEAAIKSLDYRPNLMARGLVQGRSFTLALLIPSIANPFYPEIALEVEQRARESRFQVLLCNTRYDPKIGREYLERVSGGSVDGVIALEGGISLDDLHDLSQRGMPVVGCIWGEELQHEARDSFLARVDVDFQRAGEIAAEHLVQLGHSSFAAIVVPTRSDHPGHSYRLRGFQRGLERAGFHLPESHVRTGNTTIKSGRRALEELLSMQEFPTGLFVSNDMMALGAMEAALDAGLRIPADLSVIGLDDISFSKHFRPALTTVAVPKREMALRATEMLLRLIEQPDREREVVVLEPSLVFRQSTGAPPRASQRKKRQRTQSS